MNVNDIVANVFLTIFTCSLVGCHQSNADHSIRTVLDEQVVAWNKGDIEGFMDGYWRNDDLVFESPDSITKGWQATLERYKRRYPDRATMGQLEFRDLDVALISDDEASVSGRFYLTREAGPLSGSFELTMKRFDEGWRIVKDRTVGD